MCVIVCLYGADGSGKSTLARKIFLKTHKHDKNITIVWMRGTHTFASILARILSFFKIFEGPCNPYYNICIPTKMKRLWLWIELFSAMPIIFIRFKLPKLLKTVIIAERSPFDFLIWLITTLSWVKISKSFVMRTIISLSISTCKKHVYVRANKKTLLTRRGNDIEQKWVSLQLRLYDVLPRIFGSMIIDTTNAELDINVARVLGMLNKSGVLCEQ